MQPGTQVTGKRCSHQYTRLIRENAIAPYQPRTSAEEAKIHAVREERSLGRAVCTSLQLHAQQQVTTQAQNKPQTAGRLAATLVLP